jgi:protein TonB
MGVEGKVFVQFVVDKDGTLTDIKAVKGIGAGCDEEAVRVLKAAPKWKPGKQRGRPVKVRMILPITFKLG